MSCFWLKPTGKARETIDRHLPLGFAWLAFRTPTKTLYKLISGLAKAYDDMSVALCRLASELNPYTTNELLPEWEEAVGIPHHCFTRAVSKEKRREQVLFRLSRRRWTTDQDWHDLAALFGLEIRITPGWLLQREGMYQGWYPIRYLLFPKLGRFRVYIDVLNVEFGGYAYDYPFPYGVAADEMTQFMCVINRVKPANVVILWNQFPEVQYDGPPRTLTWGGVPLTWGGETLKW